MTAGDIINVNMTGVNNFVPAAGVEIIVLMNFAADSAFSAGFDDGVNQTTNYSTGTKNAFPWQGNKLGITNTNYYYNQSTAPTKGFSGIQIK